MKDTLFLWIRSRLDRLAIDGTADTFTREVFERALERAILAAALALILGAVAWMARRHLARGVRAVLGSTRAALAALFRELAAGIRAESRVYRVIAGSILGVGLFARLWLLDFPMRYDESYSFCIYARMPFWYIVLEWDTPNNHILNTLGMRLCTLIGGTHPWALRLPAFLSGTALVALVLLVSRQLSGCRWSSLAAAAFAATSPYLVHQATNARGYAFVSACFLTLVLLAPRLTSLGHWTLFVLISAAGFWSVPVMLYPFAALVVWMTPAHFRERRLKTLAAACACTIALVGMLYAPTLIRHSPGERAEIPLWKSKMVPLSGAQFADQLRALIRDIGTFWASAPLGAPVLVAGVLGMLAHALTAAALGVTLVILCLQRVVPPLRSVAFLLPLGYAGAGRALGALHPHLARAGVAAALVTLPFLPAEVMRCGEPMFPDARPALQAILARGLDPRDHIVCVGLQQLPLRFYCYELGIDHALHAGTYLNAPAKLLTSRRVWVLVDHARSQTLDMFPREAFQGRQAVLEIPLGSSEVLAYDLLPR